MASAESISTNPSRERVIGETGLTDADLDSIYGNGVFRAIGETARGIIGDEALAAATNGQIYAGVGIASVVGGLGIFYGGSLAISGITAGAAVAGTTVGTYLGIQAGFAALETAVEVGATSYFGGEVSVGGTLATFGKNFGVNALTGGIGGAATTAGKVGLFFGRQAIEVGADTALDVGLYGQDFGSSLAYNAVGSLGGEALFRGLRSGIAGSRRAIGAFNQKFEINPATATFFAGIPAKPFQIIRKAVGAGGIDSNAILATQRELSILSNRQADVVDRFLQSSQSRVAKAFRQAQINDPRFAQLIRGRVLDVRLRDIVTKQFSRQIELGQVQFDRVVRGTGSQLRPDVFFPNLGGRSVLFEFGSRSKLDEIGKYSGFADLVVPIIPLNRF